MITNIHTRIANLRRCLARTDDAATKATLTAAIAQAEAQRDGIRIGYGAGRVSEYTRELSVSSMKAALL